MFSRLRSVTTKAVLWASAASIFAALVGTPVTSFAAITIINVSGASNSIDLTGTTPTIFGGVAGEPTTGSCTTRDTINTCNNCFDNGLAGDLRLIACNPNRIYGNLRLQITIVSDNVDGGKPLMTTATDTALTPAVPTIATAKGVQGVFLVEWNQVCANFEDDEGFSGCETDDSGGAMSASFKVGMDKTGNGKLNDSDDDFKTVTITVHKGFFDGATTGDQSTQDEVDCDPAPEDFEGVCRFDVNPGDQKVQVRDVQAAANFPSSTDIKFENVLFFFSTVGFTNITPASPFVALPVESQDTTTFALSSDRVTGLENEVLYYFKAAVQDQARNIGFFTADGANKRCSDTGFQPPCHTAVPGEVTGVLADDLNCFIATAAWGSPMASQVRTFRAFRNKILQPTASGRAFVRLYYDYGPSAAAAIKDSEFLRTVSRLSLTPFFVYAWLALEIGAWTALALCAFFLSLPLIILRIQRRAGHGPKRAA